MIRSKKGVSPLIATVLIIALTVALTVFLMNWAFGFFKERTGETSKATREQLICASKINFDFDCVCGALATDPCTISLINDASFTFTKGVRVRLISSNQKIQTTLENDAVWGAQIVAFGSQSGTIPKPTGGNVPFEAEIFVPQVRESSTSPLIDCGTLAKLRKTCG